MQIENYNTSNLDLLLHLLIKEKEETNHAKTRAWIALLKSSTFKFKSTFTLCYNNLSF